MAKKVSNLKMVATPKVDQSFDVSWTFKDIKYLKEFTLAWEYSTGGAARISGGSSTISKIKGSTTTTFATQLTGISDRAVMITIYVTPVSETHEVKETVTDTSTSAVTDSTNSFSNSVNYTPTQILGDLGFKIDGGSVLEIAKTVRKSAWFSALNVNWSSLDTLIDNYDRMNDEQRKNLLNSGLQKIADALNLDARTGSASTSTGSTVNTGSSGVKTTTKTTTQSYWTGSTVSKTITLPNLKKPVQITEAPSVELNDSGVAITVSVNSTDDYTEGVRFSVKTSDNKHSQTRDVSLVRENATTIFNIGGNKKIQVRCIPYRHVMGKKTFASDWSDWSEEISTVPSRMKKPTLKYVYDIQKNDNYIRVGWSAVASATGYEIRYGQYINNANFDHGSPSSSITIDSGTTVYTNIDMSQASAEPGNSKWYVQIRAKNNSGEATWSPASSISVGVAPNVPTAWSSPAQSVKLGEKMTLYWQHNSRDGSSVQKSQVRAYVWAVVKKITSKPADWGAKNSKGKYLHNWAKYAKFSTESHEYHYIAYGSEKEATFDASNTYSVTITSSTDKNAHKVYYIYETKDMNSDGSINQYAEYTHPSIRFSDDFRTYWIVRTKGSYSEYSPYTQPKALTVYTMPTPTCTVYNKNGSSASGVNVAYPFTIHCSADSSSLQRPTAYTLEITSDSSYSSVDALGNRTYVSKNMVVYRRTITRSVNSVTFIMNATELMLNPTTQYHAKITIGYTSGLTSTASDTFTFNPPERSDMDISTSVGIDRTMLTAYIRPAATIEDEERPALNTKLSVYRRNADGSYTTIATDINNCTMKRCASAPSDWSTNYYNYAYYDATAHMYYYVKKASSIPEFDTTKTYYKPSLANTQIVDPHPLLNYASYRVVATNAETGEYVFDDTAPVEVGCKQIIIQWDEEWAPFDVEAEPDSDTGDVYVSTTPYSGSMIRLPFNIKTTDENDQDVSLVKYIGRKNPVSYYGTQQGVTSTWNTDIPKYNDDVVYALRKLAIYPGDVYVREPSGQGYWASISVSFSHSYDSLTIPVTFSITKVEGGK